jgi:hypothetical protein
MASKFTLVPAGAPNAELPPNAPAVAEAAPAPLARPVGFAAQHPVPPGHVRLVCPPGAETAAISHGHFSYEAFREHGPGRGRWLVDVPLDAGRHLLHRGGFHVYDPAAPP